MSSAAPRWGCADAEPPRGVRERRSPVRAMRRDDPCAANRAGSSPPSPPVDPTSQRSCAGSRKRSTSSGGIRLSSFAREAREQTPRRGRASRSIERRPPPWPTKRRSKLVDEGEDAAVVVGERLLADDRDEAPQLAAAAEEGGELVGDAAVVAARAPLADPGVHQPAERGQHVDRRVDARAGRARVRGRSGPR